ncbi:thymidylate synthase [Planomonospora sp. ID67723]|uniref:thymidylate synthase n=1 Tax=Planomonospora sp. ID67723 TaxID=2738134 RepID=UPI001E60B2FD|nr:thymidylate synthase [Planomonospora sp. ID67723]
MADLLRFASCGETWIWLMRYIREYGRPADDDRGPVIEAPAVLFEIDDLGWDDPVLETHGDSGKISLYASKFNEVTVVPPFKYSYGGRLRRLLGVDQLRWVTDMLRAKPYSKSGWISLTVPGEQPDAVPCLTSLAFRLREGKLVMTATFRSQNAFTCYLNYVPLRSIQCEVADDLEVGCGSMRVFVDVPHIYAVDVEKVEEILRLSEHDELGEGESLPGPAGRSGRDRGRLRPDRGRCAS